MINHLRETCKGNVCNKGIIDITSSSMRDNSKFEYIVDSTKRGFLSYDKPDSWIHFDFKTKKFLFIVIL